MEITLHWKKWIKIHLSTKLMVSMLLLECLLLSATIIVVENQMRKSILDEFLKRGLSVTRNLAAVNSNFVTTYNYVTLEQNVERIAGENDILYATVLFYDGEVAAYSGHEKIRPHVLSGPLNTKALKSTRPLIQLSKIDNLKYYDIAVPIFLKGEKWGTVRAGFSLEDIHISILKTRRLLLFLGSIALLCGCVGSTVLARSITRPVSALVRSVEAISNGDYGHQIHIKSRDEIGYLGKRFAEMQKIIKTHVYLLTQANNELYTANYKLRREIQEREEVEKALRHRDAMLQAVSFATERFLIGSLSKENIELVLERLGKASGLDRLRLLYYASDANAENTEDVIRIFCEWHTDDIAPKSENSGKHQENSFFGSVPIFEGNSPWGCLEFEKYQPPAKSDETAGLDGLKTVAVNLGTAIHRKRTLDCLESANHAKDNFLANMSHELRTPLTHIIGFTELAVDRNFGELNEVQEEYLNHSLQSSRHLLTVINDILDLSKIEAGKMKLQRSVIQLKRLLDDSLMSLKEDAINKEIQIETKIETIPSTISADERRLKQVIDNLLSNAVKFTPDGGMITLKARSIECAVRSSFPKTESEKQVILHKRIIDDESLGTPLMKCVEISVSDTGIGIDAEDLQRVFNRFDQMDSSLSRKYEGIGLGLFLARKFIKLHGGRIWAESDGENQGATFRFVIPV